MLERLMEILRKNNIECGEIDENTELVADLGISSLQIILMTVDLEDAFDIEIPDRAIKNLKTIGDVMKLIEKLR